MKKTLNFSTKNQKSDHLEKCEMKSLSLPLKTKHLKATGITVLTRTSNVMIPIWQSEVISDLSEIAKGNLHPAPEQRDSNLNINYLNRQQISIQRTQTQREGH